MGGMDPGGNGNRRGCLGGGAQDGIARCAELGQGGLGRGVGKGELWARLAWVLTMSGLIGLGLCQVRLGLVGLGLGGGSENGAGERAGRSRAKQGKGGRSGAKQGWGFDA